jgi:hypothetical protein
MSKDVSQADQFSLHQAADKGDIATLATLLSRGSFAIEEKDAILGVLLSVFHVL